MDVQSIVPQHVRANSTWCATNNLVWPRRGADLDRDFWFLFFKTYDTYQVVAVSGCQSPSNQLLLIWTRTHRNLKNRVTESTAVLFGSEMCEVEEGGGAAGLLPRKSGGRGGARGKMSEKEKDTVVDWW